MIPSPDENLRPHSPSNVALFSNHAHATSGGMNLSSRDWLSLFWCHRKLIFIPLAIGQILALIACIFFVKYTSTSTLLIQRPDTSTLQALSIDLGGVKGGLIPGLTKGSYEDAILLYLKSNDFYVYLAKEISKTEEGARLSRDLREQAVSATVRLARTLGLEEVLYRKIEINRGRMSDLLSSISRFQKGEPNSFSLSTTTRSPELSLKLNEFILSKTLQKISERDQEQLEDAANYIDTKLKETSALMAKNEEEILKLRNRSGEPLTGEKLIDGKSKVLTELEESRIRLGQNQQMIRQLSKKMRVERSPSSHRGTVAKSFSSLDSELSSLMARRSQSLAQGMSANSDVIVQLSEEIAKIQSDLASTTHRGKANSRDDDLQENVNPAASIANLQRENWLLKARIEGALKFAEQKRKQEAAISRDEQSFFGLTKKMEFQYALFGELTKQLFQLDVQRIAAQKRIAVVEFPAAETVGHNPRIIPTFPLALIISLVLGGFLASIREANDPLILGLKEVRRLNSPFLGVIPEFSKFFADRGERRGFWRSMIAQHHQEVPQSLAFKKIRTRLLQLHKAEGSSRVIAVHSHRPGEGKSYVSANLAASLAKLDAKVLLIDGDARAKSLTNGFGIKNKLGLYGLLRADTNSKIEDVIASLDSEVDFLSSGEFTPNSAELLQLPRFAEVLKELRKKYQFIIIDTPPWASVSDGSIIASQADINVLTIRSRITKASEVNNMIEELAGIPKNMICTVLNGSGGYSHLQYRNAA